MLKWEVPSTRANGDYILADAWNVELLRNLKVLRTRHSEGFQLEAGSFHIGDKTSPIFYAFTNEDVTPKWDTAGGLYCAQNNTEPDFFTGDIGNADGWIVPAEGSGVWRLTYYVYGAIESSTFASANGYVIAVAMVVNEPVAYGSTSPTPLFDSTNVEWGVQSVAVTSTAFNYGLNATYVKKLSSGDVVNFVTQASNLPSSSGAPRYHLHNGAHLVAEFLGSVDP